LEADAAAESTVAAELAMLKSSESFNAAAMADDTTPPPSETGADLLAQEDAEAAKVAQEQSKKDGTEMVLAQARDKQAEAREANRSELESKRAERLAESISNHMNNLSVAAASAAAGHPVGEAVAAAAAHSVHALGGHYVADGAAGVAGSSGSNGLNGGGLYAAGSSASFMRDNLADFDVNNALTDISIDSSSSLASTSVSNGWVSSDSLTNADLSRLEFSDIDNMDVLPPANSVASVDASSVVNNAMNANIDSSMVSNPALAAPAVGNVTQYGDITTYGGVVPSDMIDRSDRSLMSANSYNTANAYTATDSYGAPLVTNSSPMPAVSGTQIDANSVVSNAVYSAQAISGNVVAAVENYNTIPTGAHASLGGQSASNEYYAAQAASGTVVGSVQPNAYAADYSVQSTSNSSNSYAVDYSNQSSAVASNSYAVDYSNQSSAVASNSYAVDYSNQSNAVASNSYAVDYSNQSNSSASHSYAIDNSSQSSTASQQGTPVFASVLPSSTPADYSAPAQSMTGGLQPANSNEYYSAQATPAPSMVSSSSSYAADYSSTNSASTQYASTANSSSAQYADYSSTSSAPQYVADYSSAAAQYATAPQTSGGTEYASTTQYAPVQGQPSSFIQPSAPANEYYAAPSQSAPLVAALITPSQPISIDAGSVQSYSSPAQYYLAHANTHAENRSVESIAPVDRGPAQQSDVVYSRSGSEAYTTVAPYQHVENAESRPVSFAPSTSHNIQHGPQNVAQSESQSEAYLSQQQVHSKVQAAQGLITRMNTILAGFDAPHVVPAGSAAAAKSNVSNQVAAAKPEAPAMSAQPVAQQAPAKKSLHDLLPVQRKAKTPPKEEMVVTPPPMSNSWFDA
jgi:hypothetical protein